MDSKLTELPQRSEMDSSSKKNIQVLRPALIASIIGLILGFSNARPPATSDGMQALAGCLIAGIFYSLIVFLIVASWQGLRLYFTKPTAKESPPRYKFGFFSPIVSEDDAWLAIKGNSWGIVLLTGLSSVLAIYFGNIASGLVEMTLIVGLALMVYHRKSRIAAVGLLFLSVAGLIATGHNRFFGGHGGRNMMMAFFMVWASVRIVLATCRLQSFGFSREDGATSETKQRSNSSHNLVPSDNNQASVETDFTEEQRLSRGVQNKGGALDTPILFQKMTGSHKMLSSDHPAEEKGNGVQWALFSLVVLILVAGWLIYPTTPPPATDTPQQLQEVKPQEETRAGGSVTPPWYKDHARSLRDAGRWDELIDVARRWTELEPEDERSWYLLGEGYLGLEKYPEALAAFRKILRISPNHQEAWIKVAVTYIRAGQPKVARDIARKMKGSDPQLAREIEKLTK